MGDTGSLLIGLISVVMAIKFIEIGNLPNTGQPHVSAVPALAIAILIGPIFDTFRVFSMRIIKRTSPFRADRNHVHHRILRLGFNHMQTTIILAGVNMASIALAFLFSGFGNTIMILIIGITSLMFNWAITFCLRCRERENITLRNLFA